MSDNFLIFKKLDLPYLVLCFAKFKDMTLLTLPAKAQIFIKFSTNFLHLAQTGEETALHILKTALSLKMPEYRFDVSIGTGLPDWSLHIVNAHLNYEAVAYINNKIEYPYVNQSIHKLIREIEDSVINSQAMATAQEIEEIKQSQIRYDLFKSMESTIDELNAHMKNNRSNFIFRLNYSDIPEIWLISNNSGKLMMIAAHETALQILKKAGSLADEITSNATKHGINFALQCGQPKLNQFSSVILPNFNDSTIKNNRNAIIMVHELIECMNDIDQYHQIPQHSETVWEIYLYSYKTAAINKIKEIAYNIEAI